jgi:hypothetical protein
MKSIFSPLELSIIELASWLELVPASPDLQRRSRDGR